MNEREIIGKTDALLFAAGDSIEIDALAELFDIPTEDYTELLKREAERRHSGYEGLELVLYPGRVQLAAKKDYGDMIFSVLGKKSEEELSRAMLETLSIIAYRQPVTRPEIEELRGVNSAYIVGVLEAKGLIAEAGVRETVGRPMTYVTTEKFLRHFGITDLSELPPLPDVTESEENNNEL